MNCYIQGYVLFKYCKIVFQRACQHTGIQIVHISSNTHNKISKPLICQYDKLNIISKCDLDLFFIKNEFQLFSKMFIGLLHLYFNLIILMNPADFLLWSLRHFYWMLFYYNLIITLIVYFCTIKILLWLNALIF